MVLKYLKSFDLVNFEINYNSIMAAIFILGVYKNNQKYFDSLVFYQFDVKRSRDQLSHKLTFICVIPK